MPNARQYPFQVVEQKGALVSGSYDMTASNIAEQLKQLLATGVAASENMLNNASQQTQIDNAKLEAQGRLDAVAQQLGKQKEIVGIENATQANSLAASIAGEHMQEARQSLTQLYAQREQQGFAMINSADKNTLMQMINDGTAHNMDPLGHLKIEEQAGARLATMDTVEALKVMAKDPTLPPEQVVAAFMANQPLSSDLARASYARTISNDLNRYYQGARLDLIRQTRQMDTENLIVRMQRDISFDVRDASLTPEKMMDRIDEFKTNFKALNRTASELDVYRATAEALSGVVGSGDLARFAPGRLLPILDGVGKLAEKDPVFQNLWGKVAGDIRQQVIAREANKVGILDQLISSAKDKTGLEQAAASVLTAGASGDIFGTSLAPLAAKIETKTNELQNRINSDSRVYQSPGSHLAPLPATEAQDKAIDKSVASYQIANPMRMPDGSARSWTFPETAAFTFERTGRLTASQLERLNTAASVPLDPTKATPDQMQGWTDATATIKQLVDTAPQYVRQLVQEGSLNPKLSVIGVAAASLGKVQSAGYGVTGMAQRLAHTDEAKLLEAEAILKGESQYNFPGSKDRQYINAPKADINKAIDEVTNVDEAVRSAFSGFLTWSPTYGSQNANDAFGAAFKYQYARLRQSGMDVLPASKMAKENAKSDIEKVYQDYRLGIGRQKYVVGPDFPVISNLSTSETRKQAMQQFDSLWMSAQGEMYNRLIKEGKSDWSGWTGYQYSDLSLDLDHWKVEGTGANATLVVPIRNKGIDMIDAPDQGQQGVFKMPLDPMRMKEALDANKKRLDAVRSIPMDMPFVGVRE